MTSHIYNICVRVNQSYCNVFYFVFFFSLFWWCFWVWLLFALMYRGFGAFRDNAFEDETNDIITSNMEPGFVTALVELCHSINLFFTFPLSMTPVYDVVERWYCAEENSLWWCVRWHYRYQNLQISCSGWKHCVCKIGICFACIVSLACWYSRVTLNITRHLFVSFLGKRFWSHIG